MRQIASPVTIIYSPANFPCIEIKDFRAILLQKFLLYEFKYYILYQVFAALIINTIVSQTAQNSKTI